jgi:alpha-galactosidase
MTFHEIAEIPLEPDARIYTEGWQSWSATTWYRPGEPQHRPEHDWQHAMRFRPGTDLAEDAYQAEGLMVIDPGDGAPLHVLTGENPPERDEDIPTLRARIVDGAARISASAPVVSWTAPDATAFADAAERLLALTGAAPGTSAPRVWCTWYRYFEDLTADDVRENLAAIDELDLPIDVIQIDDGWSTGTGEGTRVRDAFGDLAALVDTIRAGGRRAGIWLAPFLTGARTTLATEHPDWLVGPAGFNWGQDQAGLDLTHPGMQEYLVEVFSGLRDLGIDYFKLDFLYAGAIPGTRHRPLDGVQAYREGMRLIREAVGPDAFLVGCGAPLLPSIGLVDAMRVSPDTFHEGGEDGSTGLRGQLSLEARHWQNGRLWINDPDCLVARPSFALRDQWAEVVRSAGGLASFSDRLAELDDHGLRMVRELLETREADRAPSAAATTGGAR